jgi:hypothetical protein
MTAHNKEGLRRKMAEGHRCYEGNIDAAFTGESRIGTDNICGSFRRNWMDSQEVDKGQDHDNRGKLFIIGLYHTF